MIVINRVDEIGAAFRRDCFSDRSLRERSNRYLLGTESVIRSSDRGARGDTVPVDWDASEKWVIFPRHRPIRRTRWTSTTEKETAKGGTRENAR